MNPRRGQIALGLALVSLTGCGTFDLPRTYLLGSNDQAAAGVSSETGLPRVELRTVRVPDYLDTTDLVRRSPSNEIKASATAQWGERVSQGVTRTLSADLTRRLPSVVIEGREGHGATRRLHVDVERLDIDDDGLCTLTARWRVAKTGDDGPGGSERGTFSTAATSKSDAAAVVAMTSAIDELSEHVANSIQKSLASDGWSVPVNARTGGL